MGRYWWPRGVPFEESREAFTAMLESRGFEQCENGSLEAGFEKVVLYGKDRTNKPVMPTHVAKQLPDGKWSSKLGTNIDITHSTVDALCGPDYGSILSFFKRRRKSE